MERRNVLKSIGLLSIVGVTGLFSACAEKESKELHEEKETKTLKPEENKLIINRQKMKIQDPENPKELELKHTPEISVKEVDEKGFTRVDISLGIQGFIHPVEENHWIDYIKLFLDDSFIGEIKYEAGKSRGFASFYVKLDSVKVIKAEIGCNLHGIWENTLNL